MSILIRYTGPKASKHLDLPVGIEVKADIQYSVVFNAPSKTVEIPVEYVEALIDTPFYEYAHADAAASHATYLDSCALPPQEPKATLVDTLMSTPAPSAPLETELVTPLDLVEALLKAVEERDNPKPAYDDIARDVENPIQSKPKVERRPYKLELMEDLV